VSGRRPEIEPDLLWILGQPYAVEVLDALAGRPATRAELRARVHAPRRAVAAAVRGLASIGAIRRRGQHGSWDLLAPDAVVYELTDNGVGLAAELSRFDVWLAICENHLRDPGGPDQY
jgi:DNA-binding HxlR family transcriptional regulator